MFIKMEEDLNTLLEKFKKPAFSDDRRINFDSWDDVINRLSYSSKEDEATNSYMIAIPATGIPKEDIQLELEYDKLIVKSQSEFLRYGAKPVNLSIKIPSEYIGTDNINAECVNGLLTIYVYKPKEKKSSIKIR